ncbi:2-deoxyglucose-6-phosphate phosphatase [Neofusicoccum parvum]|uniref:2-deoxyglucose-6-phosphate phosphatase n=1 Tax=Neofusicoccum parvum TaxID=310453 RepID=A0ACB5SDW3_9PEZI|nr:2-deoxyglucose-6-phosphate phosphatase [Neofusicoccum parvum]
MPPTQPPKPRAIIFDLLTALLDSWTAWDLAASTALAQTGQPRSASLGRAWRARYLQLTYGAGAYTSYAGLVRAAAAATPGLPAPLAADLLLANYVAWIAPWPDAAPTLARLKDAGYLLAVATNCSVELGHEAAGLCGEGVFDAVVTAEESGWYKPAKGAYEAVLRDLGCEAGEALFVAGSAADVPGAAAAGMRVVWHNRVGLEAVGEVRAEREGRTLEEVLEGIVL